MFVVKLCLITIPLVLLYGPAILGMAREWYSDANYSHGFLIPLISAYFLWEKRSTLKSLEPAPTLLGYFVLVMGLILYTVGVMGDEMLTVRISFLIVLGGLVLVFGGRKWFTNIRFSLLYLLLMIPLPYFLYNEVAVPLKLFAAKVATMILHVLSYSIYTEGNIIYLPELTLEVADACSGMRYIVSILALAVLIGWFAHKQQWKRIALALCCVPIAVGINVLRIVATAILADRYGSKVAQGFFHELAGLVVFGMAFVLLMGCSSLLGRPAGKEKRI